MIKPTPIKKAIDTLRAGDFITQLACAGCHEKMILVLNRKGNNTFELSERSDDQWLVRDPNGPFSWDSAVGTFRDSKGRPYDHINADSVVRESAGMQALTLYLKMPKIADAPYQIDGSNIPGLYPDMKRIDMMLALLTRAYAGEKEDIPAGLQLAIKMALGDADISEQQMRMLLLLMNGCTQLGMEHSGSDIGYLFSFLDTMGGVQVARGGVGDMISDLAHHLSERSAGGGSQRQARRQQQHGHAHG